MLNFRFHIISLIAVFLALAIGVLMGSSVIDRAVLESLADQQENIDARVDEVLADNQALQAAVADLRGRSQRLSEEAGQLLAGSLQDVPVAVLAMRGLPPERVDDLEALLAAAGADAEGTLWFNPRLALGTDEERRDLARALGRGEGMDPATLRDLALGEVVDALATPSPAGETVVPSAEPPARRGGQGAEPLVPPAEQAPTSDPAVPGLVELRDAGFLDFERPPDDEEATAELGAPGTRVVLVTGPTAVLEPDQWARPLVEALVGPGAPGLPVLVVEVYPDGAPEEPVFTAALRADDVLSARLSTVSRIDDFAGQLGTILALQDLGERRFGHYGRDAQRLLPAPAG